MAAFFCAFPLAKNNDSSVLELGVYCAGLAALVLVETIGKIGTVGNVAPALPVPGVESYPMASHNTQHPHARTIDSHDSHVEHASGVEYWFDGHKRYRRDDLTAYEKGEEDIGADEHLGVMKAVHIRRGQREYLFISFISFFGALSGG